MNVNVTNFLHSLAKNIATACSIAFPGTIDTTHKAGIWAGEAIESLSTDPFTTLVDYGGEKPGLVAKGAISLQVNTQGTERDEVRLRAWTIYAALCNSDGTLRTMWTIAGIVPTTQQSDGHWTIVGLQPIAAPAFLGGPDEQGRVACVFNVDLEFFKKD